MTAAKKRIVKTTVLVLALCFSAALIRACFLYFNFMTPDKSYFGEDYIQVIYPTGIRDYCIAREILADAETAFSTVTTDELAEEEFGKLGRFCITDGDAISEEHAVHLISANFGDSTGYIRTEVNGRSSPSASIPKN